MKNLKYSIIISSYNGEKFLADCLPTVFKTSFPNYEVIIVEDGSIDGSLKLLQKFQSKFKFQLIQNEHNLGLVASRNKAIKKATGDILVFLDDDTKVDKNWIRGLEATFSADTNIGAAQCKIFDFKKRRIIQEIGMKLIPFTGLGITLGRGETDHGQFDNPIEIIALGAALAVKKDVVEKIGGFDEKLFHYTDDLDFSWRIWISGYRVVLAPQAKVYHYTKIHNPNYKLYFHLSKNSLRMIIKNYEFSNMVKYMSFSLIFHIIEASSVFIRQGSAAAIIGVLQGFLWSLFFLPDTLKERSKVQKSRQATDKDIFRKAMISTNIFKIYKLYSKTEKTSVALMGSATKA